jgi:hypothetical protein
MAIRTGLLISSSALMAAVCATPGVALALCLDPKTGVSGYHVPLEEEVSTSASILVGKVVSVRRIRGESMELGAYSASIYTVHVEQQLKGKAPSIFTVYDENTSARYSMNPGERHLLFIRMWPYKIANADFQIDSCGNSDVLPQGDGILRDVKALLGAR